MNKSILTLTDSELEQQFGEFVKQSTVKENAEVYRAEIIQLIKEGKIDAIKPIYRKMNSTPLFHQARLYLAFGDEKGAITCFKKSIEKGEKIDDSYFYLGELEEDDSHYHNVSPESIFYPKARLKLGISCLDDHDYNTAISYWSDVPSQSDEYEDAQYNITEIYFQRSKRGSKEENLRFAYKHIRNVKGNNSLKNEIEEQASKYGIDLTEDSL